jgi:hypothetical protein
VKLERLRELVNERKELSIEDENVISRFAFNGQQKMAMIPVQVLLTKAADLPSIDEEELVVSVLDSLRLASETERQHQASEAMHHVMKLANRYLYVRDNILNQKRGDLPEPLYTYFYNTVDIKYPTTDDIDAAIDELMEQ